MKPATPETAHDKAVSVALYDTTLRDGTQREGLSLSSSDKLRIAQALDALGVAFVEAGFPGSNPKDAEVFERAQGMTWKHAALAAFGATCRPFVAAAEDPQLRALLGARTPVCTIFGKSWTVHVDEVLRTSRDENLRMIEDSVRMLAQAGRRVVYDAEHFFDGYAADAVYALETLRAAVRGGAEVVVLCDTNGGTLPWAVEDATRAAVLALPGTTIGIHAHDDTGCAVASSLAAVRAGARHVQGTVNGYGERCGNASLTTLIPTLELKLGLSVVRPGALAQLTALSRFVAEVANVSPDDHAPYVGRSAFAHKGGVHVAAIERAPRAYEHVDPALVGNGTRVVVSELSGRANVRALAEEHGLPVSAEDAAVVLSEVKDREKGGFAFEAAEASVALLLARRAPGYIPPFELVDYKVLVGHGEGRTGPTADAALKLRIDGELVHVAAEGNGPVSALDAALRKALVVRYPEIAAVRLADYKVRILDGRDGTSATTRVLVTSTDGHVSWTTVGASPSIVESSFLAVADALEYGILQVCTERKGAA